MTDSQQNELLEIYKLHAELADRVSQRRERANRLYVSLLVGLVVLLAALLRFGIGDGPLRIVLCAAGTIGALLSVSWYVVIRSYRQLNAGKFKALHELEGKLAYPFFVREWELLAEGQRHKPLLAADECRGRASVHLFRAVLRPCARFALRASLVRRRCGVTT